MTNDMLTHMRIIRTWAEVDGKSGRGIDPVCCADIVKWIDEVLKELKPIQVVYGSPKLGKFYATRCGNCEEQVRDGFKYCPHCGRPVKWNG